MSEGRSVPRGAVIWDAETDELRTERVWTVIDGGRTRELRIRVGRGIVRDVQPTEET